MTYAEANKRYNEAWAKFNPVQRAFTDINIPMGERPSVVEYMCARAEFRKAELDFDAAFNLEQGKQ